VNDPYEYEIAPGVLKNKYGITDPAKLAVVERAAAYVDGHRKLPTGGHLWRILWPWFLPAYGQIVPHLL